MRYFALIGTIFCACGTENRNADSDTVNSHQSAEALCEQKCTSKTVETTGNPDKDWIFVEQAVDAWLYFNLSDFKSYEPLIRSTEYNKDRDIYIHHLRFRYMNEQGGIVSVEKTFEVDLYREGENGNPFFVKEIH